MENQTRIGWIGIGKMGLPMAANLLSAEHSLTIFNRSADKCASLSAKGAQVAATPRDAAAAADVLFTMVADDTSLADMVLGEAGALAGMATGSILVDMSTVSPQVSAHVAAAAAERDVGYLRAPVSGSVAMAEAAKLTVLVSGPAADAARCNPLFAAMSAKQFYVGCGEEARILKLSLNLMIGTSAAMLAEALTLGEAAGVDWQIMLDVIASSAVASPFVAYKLGQLKTRDFTPMFRADQMAKDFGLILAAADEKGVAMPVARDVAAYWQEMIATGLGGEDFIACLAIAERAANLKV